MDLITIKQYAESRGISTQAVHKKISRDLYKERLEGHITEGIVNGKKIKLLDEEAVEILDGDHSVVVVSNLEKFYKHQVEEETAKNKLLLDQLQQLNYELSQQQTKTLKLEDKEKEYQKQKEVFEKEKAEAEEKLEKSVEELKSSNEIIEKLNAELEDWKRKDEERKRKGIFGRIADAFKGI